MEPNSDEILRAQIEYYRARAGEYDDWFARRGRYDRGPELNGAWFDDVATVRSWVDAWIPRGRILELAAGTGIWTERLVRKAERVTAVDASGEVLALNRERVDAVRGSVPRTVAEVDYRQADLFTWRPAGRFDGIFFGFWLSHVPPDRFDAFWDLVQASLEPGGTVCFVDSRYEPTSTARDHQLEGKAASTVLRRLDDGREYRIVKVFHRAGELAGELTRRGWRVEVRETPRYFLYGEGAPGSGG